MAKRTRIGCGAIAITVMLVVLVGVPWLIVVGINGAFKHENTLHTYGWACEYLGGLIEAGEPWPASEDAFWAGYRAYTLAEHGWGEELEMESLIRFNPAGRPEAVVCSEDFPLHAEFFTCEGLEDFGGAWLREIAAAHPGYFADQANGDGESGIEP